jgi:D-glycero-alpha-D-manno-heptose 1-phosphate guanylyltransferase
MGTKSNTVTEFTEIDALILAGGMGTRLRSVLPNKQKVVAPVDGQPFLLRIITTLHHVGVRRIILALGYRAEDVLSDIIGLVPAEVQIIPSVEVEMLGTAGALRHALPLIISETVLVANGDSFIDADLPSFLAFHLDVKAQISMLLCKVPDISRYGSVSHDGSGQVLEFLEKRIDVQKPGVINAGIYLMDKSVIESFPYGTISLEKDAFPKYCGKGLYGMRQEGRFIDIGTPEDYGKAAEFFAENNRSRA